MDPGPPRNCITQNGNSFLYLRGPPTGPPTTQNLSFVSSAIQAYATQNPWWGPNAKAILRRRRTRLLVDAQNLNVRSRWTQKLFCVGGPASIKSIYEYGCKKYFRFVSWGPASIKNGCKNYFDWVLWRRKMPRASFSRLLGFGLVSFGTFAFRPLFFRALVVVQLSWSRVQDRSGRELDHRRRSGGTVYVRLLSGLGPVERQVIRLETFTRWHQCCYHLLL